MKIKKTLKQAMCASTLLACGLISHTASADIGLGIRAGTYGLGADLNVGLSDHFGARIGYNYLSYDDTVEDTEVTYDGTFEINSFSGMLDWYPGGGGFRFTLGAIASGPKIEVNGTPAPGTTVDIGDNTYTAAQVGSLRGELKFGSSVAPYVGLGYGNPAGKNHRVTFLFDLGATYGGEPQVNLTAQCGASIVGTPTCTRLQNDVAKETQELKEEATAIKWWPVISLGIGIRF